MKHVLCTIATVVTIATFALNAQIKEIRSENELNRLLQEKQLPVIVKFFGSWCGPCQRSEKPFKEIADNLADVANFATVNIDVADKEFVSEHAGQGVPTFVIFTAHKAGPRAGKVYVGYNGAQHLENWITENLEAGKKNGELDDELTNEQEHNLEPVDLTEENEVVALSDDIEPVDLEPIEEHVVEEEYIPEEAQPGVVGSVFGWIGDTVNSFFGTLFGQ